MAGGACRAGLLDSCGAGRWKGIELGVGRVAGGWARLGLVSPIRH